MIEATYTFTVSTPDVETSIETVTAIADAIEHVCATVPAPQGLAFQMSLLDVTQDGRVIASGDAPTDKRDAEMRVHDGGAMSLRDFAEARPFDPSNN